MASVPQRQSLANQIYDYLRAEIDEGTWKDWLPPEHQLSSDLRVSRSTLRKALARLRGEGFLQPVHGMGSRIVAKASGARKIARDPVVGFLSPNPIDHMLTRHTLLVNTLKDLFGREKIGVQFFSGRHYYGKHPARALSRMVAQNSVACWMLVTSSEAQERWFAQREISAVIAGARHPGCKLPCVDLDYGATCRHAVGTFLGLGHRKIALLNENPGNAGHVESELGFLEGFRKSSHIDAQPVIQYHRDSVSDVHQILDRLFLQTPPPTAMVIVNSHDYLTVMSYLAEKRLRIPDDLSVISRNHDPNFDYLTPTPACYTYNLDTYARKVFGLVMKVINHEPVPESELKLVPKYREGDSVCAVAPEG